MHRASTVTQMAHRAYAGRMDVEVLEDPRGGAPRRGSVRIGVKADGLPLIIDLHAVQERDGTTGVQPWEVRGLYIQRKDGGPLSSTIIRRVPVAELLSVAINAWGDESRNRLAAAALEMREAGRQGPTDMTLHLVADVYSSELMRRGNPVQAVADAFEISRSTATRWVRRARDAGHLELMERERGGRGAAEE